MDGNGRPEIAMNGKIERRLYDSVEARELLGGISEPTFRRLTKAKELRVVRIGVKVYVEPEAIDEFIAAHRDQVA